MEDREARMSIEELAVKLRQLAPEQQQEVFDLVESLYRARSARTTPRRSIEGLWADLGIDITEEDIAEARREMWGNFPREFPPDDR